MAHAMPQLKPNTKNVARIERRGALDRTGAAADAMCSAFMEESRYGAIRAFSLNNYPTA